MATASSPRTSVVFRAVPRVTQPPHVKRVTMVSTIDATHDRKTSVFVGRAPAQAGAGGAD